MTLPVHTFARRVPCLFFVSLLKFIKNVTVLFTLSLCCFTSTYSTVLLSINILFVLDYRRCAHTAGRISPSPFPRPLFIRHSGIAVVLFARFRYRDMDLISSVRRTCESAMVRAFGYGVVRETNLKLMRNIGMFTTTALFFKLYGHLFEI